MRGTLRVPNWPSIIDVKDDVGHYTDINTVSSIVQRFFSRGVYRSTGITLGYTNKPEGGIIM